MIRQFYFLKFSLALHTVEWSNCFILNKFNFACHLFAFSLNVKQFDLTQLDATRVDLGVMAMKGPIASLKAPALLGPHYKIV